MIAKTPPRKTKLRVTLAIGQCVRVVGLPGVCVTGVVRGLIDRGVDSDLISDDGYWTIETSEGLRRDFERRHLVDARGTLR